MKKVQNAKKKKAAFNSNNAPKRKFRIVQKAPQNFQREPTFWAMGGETSPKSAAREFPFPKFSAAEC
jgi:hypothetical protein